MPRGARPGRRPGESPEERSERRQEARERLRCRNNVTTCRRPARPAPRPERSARQTEFLRRRNLPETLPGQEAEARTPPDPSSRVEPSPSILQHPRSCPTLPPAGSLLSLSTPRGRGDSLNTRGTQTPPTPSSGVRDSSQQTDWGIAVLNKEMVQLSNYLKEALHRELLLKQKMMILQELLSTLLQASEKSWQEKTPSHTAGSGHETSDGKQGQLNEDKLRCKLRVLENQLQACTQSYSKECVKKILIEMEDQKQTYEQKAKEALQKMLEDKLQTEQQLQNSQRSLAETREDLAFWKEHDASLKAELTRVTAAHSELQNSFQALQSELQAEQAVTVSPRPAGGGAERAAEPGAAGAAGGAHGAAAHRQRPAQRQRPPGRTHPTHPREIAERTRAEGNTGGNNQPFAELDPQPEQPREEPGGDSAKERPGFHHTDPTSHPCQGKTKRSVRAPRGGGGNRKSEG
ncbi:TRAF3-interacting JNK-activating modulator isoform 4-T6 [Sylvia borin]